MNRAFIAYVLAGNLGDGRIRTGSGVPAVRATEGGGGTHRELSVKAAEAIGIYTSLPVVSERRLAFARNSVGELLLH